MTVNYERGNFSVSQCTFDDGSTPQVTTIQSLTSAGSGESSKGIGPGPIVGIVISIIALIALIGASIFLYLRRRKQRDLIEPRDVIPSSTPEPSHTVLSPNLSARTPEPEQPITNTKTDNDINVWMTSTEMESEPVIIPMHKLQRQRSELSNASQIRPELPAGDNREVTYFEEDQRIRSSRKADRTAELDGSGILYELDAGPQETGRGPVQGLSPIEPPHASPAARNLESQISPVTNAEDETPVQPTSWLDMSERIAGTRRTGSPPVSPLRPEDRGRESSSPTSAPGSRGGSRFGMRASLGVSSPLSNASNEDLYRDG